MRLSSQGACCGPCHPLSGVLGVLENHPASQWLPRRVAWSTLLALGPFHPPQPQAPWWVWLRFSWHRHLCAVKSLRNATGVGKLQHVDQTESMPAVCERSFLGRQETFPFTYHLGYRGGDELGWEANVPRNLKDLLSDPSQMKFPVALV